jgi:5-methylcytosine-specific restriction endonuclease McrA
MHEGGQVMLMDEAALRERCNKARYDILRRAKPVLWKSGKRQGKVKRPGITKLEFTSQDLWQHALRQVGSGARQCPYCLAIGRPAFLITLANYVWDHKIPLAAGGTSTLDNLLAVCEDCNRLKGDLSYDFFVAVMAAVEKWDDPRDRSIFHNCLRTHGRIQRMRFEVKKKPEEVVNNQPPPTTKMLPLIDTSW